MATEARRGGSLGPASVPVSPEHGVGFPFVSVPGNPTLPPVPTLLPTLSS